MNILYVINGFDRGGAEHGLLTLIESGSFKGHELRVLAFCRGRGKLADRVMQKLGMERIHLTTLSDKLTIWACIIGFFQILIISFHFRPQKMVLSLKQANVVGRLAAIFMPRVTCVAFEHTTQYRARRFNGLYGPLLRLLSWRVDEIWADCVDTLEKTSGYYLTKKRARHVISLFSVDANKPYKTNYDIGSELHLVAAGRLVPCKNVTLIVELVASLRVNGIAAILDVFGDGPYFDALLSLIEKRGLQSQVFLRGYCAEWVEHAIDADIFINLSEMEGFCIVVAEAMAAGLPVIAVNVGGIRDYGCDNINMLKLNAADVGDTLSLVHRLRIDRSQRKSLGEHAREDMRKAYDISSCNERMRLVLSVDKK